MVVGEVLMNPAAVSVSELGRVKLSANWMCAAGKEGEGAGMYEAVKALGMELLEWVYQLGRIWCQWE